MLSAACSRPNALNALRDLPDAGRHRVGRNVVKKSAQRKLARNFKAGKVINVQGAGHEILMETDERRDQFWKAFEEMCRSREGLIALPSAAAGAASSPPCG
jgi:hypothetical protein